VQFVICVGLSTLDYALLNEKE